jgi:hypothetical protein
VNEFVGLHNSSVLDFRDAKLPQAITIADLGCSSGPNTCYICGYSDHRLDLEKVLSNGPITTTIFYFTE